MKGEWGWRQKHNLTECATKETQSNRMSIIGEGIEGLMTKSLHTPLNRVCKVFVPISVIFVISHALNSSRHSPSAVSFERK